MTHETVRTIGEVGLFLICFYAGWQSRGAYEKARREEDQDR